MSQENQQSEDIEYLSPFRHYPQIDPDDWAYWNKAKFDVIDKKRLKELNAPHSRRLGREKYKKLNAKLGTRDLRRWLENE